MFLNLKECRWIEVEWRWESVEELLVRFCDGGPWRREDRGELRFFWTYTCSGNVNASCSLATVPQSSSTDRLTSSPPSLLHMNSSEIKKKRNSR